MSEQPDYDEMEPEVDDYLECPVCGRIFLNDGGGLCCSAMCEERDEMG